MKSVCITMVTLLLLFTVSGCAHNKQTVQEEGTSIEQQEPSEGSVFEFIGALCLFGLYTPPKDKDTEYIYDLEDSFYNPLPRAKKEKR